MVMYHGYAVSQLCIQEVKARAQGYAGTRPREEPGGGPGLRIPVDPMFQDPKPTQGSKDPVRATSMRFVISSLSCKSLKYREPVFRSCCPRLALIEEGDVS